VIIDARQTFVEANVVPSLFRSRRDRVESSR
jgi:hypothetical protein